MIMPGVAVDYAQDPVLPTRSSQQPLRRSSLAESARPTIPSEGLLAVEHQETYYLNQLFRRGPLFRTKSRTTPGFWPCNFRAWCAHHSSRAARGSGPMVESRRSKVGEGSRNPDPIWRRSSACYTVHFFLIATDLASVRADRVSAILLAFRLLLRNTAERAATWASRVTTDGSVTSALRCL